MDANDYACKLEKYGFLSPETRSRRRLILPFLQASRKRPIYAHSPCVNPVRRTLPCPRFHSGAGAICLLASALGGVKDWGHMIEGHGGMLDRLDSVCFAAPIFFHLVRYGWT